MRRTEWLQETRLTGWEEAYDGCRTGRLNQEEAAQLLGICDRSFHRDIDGYEEDGLDGLRDKRISEVSQRRAPCLATSPGPLAGPVADSHAIST